MNFHFRIFLKHLAKNKLYTFVTISGYAVSLVFILLLSVYIRQELSVDQFHAKKDRIFRLYTEDASYFAPPVGDFIKEKCPEVENYCRTFPFNSIATVAGQKFKMDYLLADSSFFSMFSFKLENYGRANVLATKNSIVLSRSFARKVFGNVDPVGQEVTVEQGKQSFLVTAIMDDFPENTHFRKFDAVVNFPVLADLWGYKEILTTYYNCSFNIYFLAKPKTNLPSKAPHILELFKKDYWIFKESRAKELKFEPLTEVYFSNSTGAGIRQNSKTLIMVFMVIVLLILSVAVINFVNLTVAQAGFRGKEIAIKKLMGCLKAKLIFQHISESVALSIFSLSVAVLLAFLVEPYFNTLLNTDLMLASQFNWHFVLLLLVGALLLGIISGLFPALVISRFSPLEVVKGTFAIKSKGTYTKVLIGFQYCIAIILLICSWGISRQTNFMRSYDTGFQKENIFWMGNTIKANQKLVFSDVLRNIPGVSAVSYACGSPIDGENHNQSFTYNGKPVSFQQFIVDSAFFSLMGLKITPSNAAYSKKGCYLNHTALSELELPANTTSFKFYNQELPVLGIVNDFNVRSLHHKIGPVMICLMDENRYPWQIFVKVSGANLVETVDKIKNAQAKFTGGMPMESGFIDSTISQWYQREERAAIIVRVFTLLAIIISVMGIFAMSLYYVQQKVKEIGIRKINGAEVLEVIVMLNKDFVSWVVIAFVIACPISWYAMHRWLENFAYKTEMSWWIFAISGLVALGIALLTVSWQSWKAATQNPVEALRYE